MNILRRRFRSLDEHDDGVTLIEVMVAMFIFALVAMGVAYTLIQSLTLVRDSSARSAATSLASQEIDRSRAIVDVFDLGDVTYQQQVDGRLFTVTRVSRWVTDSGQDLPCGAPGGALQYKRVNVSVTWPGLSSPSRSVRADTLIAPSVRISEPGLGTILVSVIDGVAVGLADVNIVTTPALVPVATKTDSQGCSYLLKVRPGTYRISVNRAGYIDTKQDANPFTSVTVTAGGSIDARFQMAEKKVLTMTYASPTVAVPTNLDMSLLHETDAVVNIPATTANKTRTKDVYPYVEGYSVVAGQHAIQNEGTAGCLSPNPMFWQASTVGTVNYAAVPNAVVQAPTTLPVPMGTVVVKGTANSQFLTAVSQTTGPTGTADPGCGAVTMTYKFGQVLNSNVSLTVALPYGSWKFFNNSAGTGTPVAAANITATAPSTVTSVSGVAVVTLDPRVVVP